MIIFFRNKAIVVLILVLSGGLLNGQSVKLFYPLGLSPAISGSFGEIRTDHFHSGVDFRTNGKTDYKVYASEDGFVSRIKVSSVGFGKTIYIEHPNGLTTVYAHLGRFSDRIARIVEKEQYQKNSFEVELFPSRNEIEIKKGEVIAFSGNSGSSGGPHLHYEIRHTSSQIPISPLNYFDSWTNADNSAPTINKIYLYQIDSIGYMTDSLSRQSLNFNKNRSFCSITDTISAFGLIGLGIESYDYVNEQSNRCGFERVSVFINEQNIYSLNIDSFAFAETKYSNSIIDYYTKITRNEEIVKLWVDENNKFSGLKYNKSKGFISIEDGKIYNFVIEIEDFAGNKTIAKGTIKGRSYKENKSISIRLKNAEILDYTKEHKISTEKYEVFIPKNALYHDIIFSHSIDSLSSNHYCIYKINTPKVPIHKKYTLVVKRPNVSKNLLAKTYIGYINVKGIEFCESKITDEGIEATCSKFGNYTVVIDTISPRIIPLNLSEKSKLSPENMMKFKLSDDSGISTYNGYIDGNWVLFEWDPKSNLLTHTIKKQRIAQGTWHKLMLEVTDKLNNKSKYSCDFFW